ncbi:MAG: BON domain-containing protein [Planctomycetaceae bacterium]|nr:BON domain-containing protein [Planctomycetaceae bacterium]
MSHHEIRLDAAHPLEPRIHMALQQALPALNRGLRWRVRAKNVCLTGVVGSYYQKQVAQEALLQIGEIEQVVNLLRVRRPSDLDA